MGILAMAESRGSLTSNSRYALEIFFIQNVQETSRTSQSARHTVAHHILPRTTSTFESNFKEIDFSGHSLDC